GSQLGAERGAATPAETRSSARPEIARRPARPAMLGHQGVFVDDDRVFRLGAGDASAGPGHMDRAQGRSILAGLLPFADKPLSLLAAAPPPPRNGASV